MARREKRRLLDAQRGKCRVRLGSHLDEWCALKDHLGFAQHAQVAKFLLDRYMSTSNSGTCAPSAITLFSVSLSSLERLADLCHRHARDCPTPPTVLSAPQSGESLEMSVLQWGCTEHQFSWNPRDFADADLAEVEAIEILETPKSLSADADKQEEKSKVGTRKSKRKAGILMRKRSMMCLQEACQEPTRIEGLPKSVKPSSQCSEGAADHKAKPRGEDRISEDKTQKTQSLKSDAQDLSVSKVTKNSSKSLLKRIPRIKYHSSEPQEVGTGSSAVVGLEQSVETAPPPRVLGDRTDRQERQAGEEVLPARKEGAGKIRGDRLQEFAAHPKMPEEKAGSCQKRRHELSCPTLDPSVATEAARDPASDMPSDTETAMETCTVEESIAEEVIGINESSDDSESAPAEESQMEQSSDAYPAKAEDQQGNDKANRPKPFVDEELAQISKKRIRKATHPELLMCEYDDCGKIFSKRQYLNYHQKYQHMNQRTFRCSVSDCGKSFNFKKHLKEHEKRHSDRRDYICEFCARGFRSSSNLIIHRRIHTGEKPLQCEFCGFTCRQKASLNWHMKKHDAASFYQFPCDLCGQRFEKRENLAAHKNRKHPESRDATPLLPIAEDIPSGEGSSLADLAPGAECPKADEPMAAAPQDSMKETALHEYLDLAERVLESQPTTPAPDSSNIPVVIVL